MKLQLEGRTALVTGATSGIGRGIAEALAAEGVKLAISGRREAGLTETADASRPMSGMADDAAWEEALTLNFAGARRLTNALAGPMRDAKWGRIINLTGALVAPGWNASGAAKAALHSWSRTMAIQFAPHGITVNAIAPGRINSEQIRNKLHPTEKSRDDFIRQYIPMGHFGEPQDLAALVVFLASPLARYISGAAIPVDGAMFRIS